MGFFNHVQRSLQVNGVCYMHSTMIVKYHILTISASRLDVRVQVVRLYEVLYAHLNLTGPIDKLRWKALPGTVVVRSS